ncbi:MAG: transglutaminase domain-containing protein [Candidatus Altiarchaeota archaeon]|nr:transglutaminase domain-containing protein [Candidatus Altiarchaeota archaeon]
MPFDSRKAVDDFLSGNGIPNAGDSKRLAAVVRSVASIPFGEGRTLRDVLETRKAGTCTGKHLLLKACLVELGIECREVACTFKWDEQKIRYPPNMQAILDEGGWEHGHNFLQLKISGRWVDVDVTWNPQLRPYGFRAFPEDWDAKTHHVGLDRIITRWDGVDVMDQKRHFISSLAPEIRGRRERFLKALFEWTGAINRVANTIR